MVKEEFNPVCPVCHILQTLTYNDSFCEGTMPLCVHAYTTAFAHSLLSHSLMHKTWCQVMLHWTVVVGVYQLNLGNPLSGPCRLILFPLTTLIYTYQVRARPGHPRRPQQLAL